MATEHRFSRDRERGCLALPGILVDLRGLEPLTPCMPCRCATSCATGPSASEEDSTTLLHAERLPCRERRRGPPADPRNGPERPKRGGPFGPDTPKRPGSQESVLSRAVASVGRRADRKVDRDDRTVLPEPLEGV